VGLGSLRGTPPSRLGGSAGAARPSMLGRSLLPTDGRSTVLAPSPVPAADVRSGRRRMIRPWPIGLSYESCQCEDGYDQDTDQKRPQDRGSG
jgi:hypothetical protein